MASIRDVAQKAGVAVSTVSKVVNGYPNVSEETREKVNGVVRELNFTPNTIASALSSKRAGRVALLINQNTQAVDEVAMQYLSGAINRAQKEKLDVITVFFSMIRDREADDIIRYFQAQSIEGILIYGLSRDDGVLHELIGKQCFRVVAVDAPFVNRNTSSVGIDHEWAQYEVAKKTILENRGKRILYITGKKNGYVTKERMAGMWKLAQEEGLSLTVRRGDFSEKKARELTFACAGDVDIIVCASDLMAIGAMRALQEMDIFRPVCGFDGITLMGYAGKQMNTVRQDFHGVSATAMEEMARLLDGGEGRRITTDYELVRMQYLDIIH